MDTLTKGNSCFETWDSGQNRQICEQGWWRVNFLVAISLVARWSGGEMTGNPHSDHHMLLYGNRRNLRVL